MLWKRKMEKYPTLCCSAFRSCVRSTFSSSSSSALCLTLFMALWYSRSWFWNKRAEIRPMGQETWAESDVKPSTYSDSRHSAVETMEASPGNGAGIEVDQLAANGREGHLDALQILQQKQDTAVTHCQGNGAVSTGPFPGASLTSFPRTAGYRPSHLTLSGLFATGISYSCMQTSHCFPVSPLEQVHSPVRGSQEPPLHSHSVEFNNRETPMASFCAVATPEGGEGVVLFQLCNCIPAYLRATAGGFPVQPSNMHRNSDSSQLFSTFNNSISTHATNALSHSSTCGTQHPGSRTHLYSHSR